MENQEKIEWSGKELYVIVDKGVCTACGSCMCWSPDVFSYDKFSLGHNRLDDNTGTVPIPEAVWQDVLPTGYLCPPKAIKHSDKPFIGFKATAEFGTESPENPNITYELSDQEITVNEIGVAVPTSSGCGCGSSCGCGSHDHSEHTCTCGGNGPCQCNS